MTYAALCCRDVHEYVALHREFLESHMTKSKFSILEVAVDPSYAFFF